MGVYDKEVEEWMKGVDSIANDIWGIRSEKLMELEEPWTSPVSKNREDVV